MPRFQLRIRWLMIAVAVVAGLLALPAPFDQYLIFLAMIEAIPVAIVAMVAGPAPRGQRRAVAFWAAALHPWALLLWLLVVRSTWLRQPLVSQDRTLALRWVLEIPYVSVVLAIVIVLPALFCGSVVAAGVRHGRGIERVFALPVVWGLTWVVLECDPFALKAWVWD